ncbi:MAG: histidine kinase [Marinilabiliales bacterium]|nr:histidine kinase [Marinilabiliales bacterium]
MKIAPSMVNSQLQRGNRIKILLHAIAWSIVIIIPLYINMVFGGSAHRLYTFYLHTLASGIIFYVGYLWLVPRFFLKEKYLWYGLILLGLILGTHLLGNFIEDYVLYNPVEEKQFFDAMKKVTGKDENFRPSMKIFGLVNHISTALLLSGFAIGLGVMEKLKQNEKKQKEMEKEKLHSELAFLKNQVSPHFFFNTLNNIYSLIGIDGPTAQDSVLKLSKMMRYLLYESEQGETRMSHEISFMLNYVDLMKLRLSQRVDLQVSFPEEFADFSIPPLLFIPFVENAFKHGVGQREASFIRLEMQLDGQEIVFTASNSICNSRPEVDPNHSGIGLENVRKRLNLLFPGRHDLKIEATDTVYTVVLKVMKDSPYA